MYNAIPSSPLPKPHLYTGNGTLLSTSFATEVNHPSLTQPPPLAHNFKHYLRILSKLLESTRSYIEVLCRVEGDEVHACKKKSSVGLTAEVTDRDRKADLNLKL